MCDELSCNIPKDFETILSNCIVHTKRRFIEVNEYKWEGYIWDESFTYLHDRDCVFKFTAHYGNGVEIEDEVTVYIVRDFYWELHREDF
ncbi:MAG: hypothetical protein M1308_23465 [Actinobacteria bacterium]|nr:hypothetical protein [Actinomycetota bacterium]